MFRNVLHPIAIGSLFKHMIRGGLTKMLHLYVIAKEERLKQSGCRKKDCFRNNYFFIKQIVLKKNSIKKFSLVNYIHPVFNISNSNRIVWIFEKRLNLISKNKIIIKKLGIRQTFFAPLLKFMNFHICNCRKFFADLYFVVF